MINSEVELKTWLPAFKVLTYFGSQKERKAKRVGWTRSDSFHVSITYYTLVVHDVASVKPEEWVYLIVDGAHKTKNFQSRQWQFLRCFSFGSTAPARGNISPEFRYGIKASVTFPNASYVRESS